MDVLIAGCGYLGQELGRRLHERGDQVLGLRRFPPKNAALSFPILGGDLSQAGGLAALDRVPRQVVFCAAAESYHDEAYRLAYVVGPELLLRRFEDLGGLPERVLFVSSTAVYHQDDGSWINERSPCAPQSFSGQRLLEGEAALRAFDTTTVMVRSAGIYGPGRRRLIDQFLTGTARRDGRLSYSNRIHRDDLAQALIHLLLLAAPEDLYLAVDHEPATKDEIWRWLAQETGRELPPQQESELSALRYGSNKRCRNDRLVDSGFEFSFPTYRAGFRALLAAAPDDGQSRGS